MAIAAFCRREARMTTFDQVSPIRAPEHVPPSCRSFISVPATLTAIPALNSPISGGSASLLSSVNTTGPVQEDTSLHHALEAEQDRKSQIEDDHTGNEMSFCDAQIVP